MYAFYSFNTAKAHPVDVHFQAFPFYLVTVALSRFIAVNELATAIHTDVILFIFILSVLTDMGQVTFRTLHKDLL